MDSHFVDEELFNIGKRIKILSSIKPTNMYEEKEKVFIYPKHNPIFVYKKSDVNFNDLREALDSLEIDGSHLGLIFKAKMEEMHKELNLIESVTTNEFTKRSLDLYGTPSEEVIERAHKELSNAQIHDDLHFIDAKTMKRIFEARFRDYGLTNWRVKIKKDLTDDVTATKKSKVFLRDGIFLSKQRAMSMVRHEIDCHVLRTENGKHQPYKIFFRGFPNYLKTEEGLAIHMVNQLGLNVRKEFFPQARVVLCNLALRGSFSDVMEKALEYGFIIDNAWNLALRLKRGLKDTSRPGAFTKDSIYYPNSLIVEDFLKSNHIKELFYGKVGIEHIDLAKKVPGVVQPKHLPFQLKIQFIEKYL